jgi:hypothetical protein
MMQTHALVQDSELIVGETSYSWNLSCLKTCQQLCNESPRLKQQWNNATQWVRTHRAAYACFRYAPYQNEAVSSDKIDSCRIGRSTLLPGYLGVYPEQSSLAPHRFVASYAGIMIWEELLNEFAQQFHCPTALALPQLNYVVDDPAVADAMGLRHRSGGGYKVQVLILGNPCLAACIINSPMGLGRTANCKLISEQLKDISKHLSKQADGKVQVAATIA